MASKLFFYKDPDSGRSPKDAVLATILDTILNLEVKIIAKHIENNFFFFFFFFFFFLYRIAMLMSKKCHLFVIL